MAGLAAKFVFACAFSLYCEAASAKPVDSVEWCQPADTDQHQLCKMRPAGEFLGINAEMRFIVFDRMSNTHFAVYYVFPLNRRSEVETAIDQHLPSADVRLNPWGHPEGTKVWRQGDRKYLLEPHDGKLSVQVTQNDFPAVQ